MDYFVEFLNFLKTQSISSKKSVQKQAVREKAEISKKETIVSELLNNRIEEIVNKDLTLRSKYEHPRFKVYEISTCLRRSYFFRTKKLFALNNEQILQHYFTAAIRTEIEKRIAKIWQPELLYPVVSDDLVKDQIFAIDQTKAYDLCIGKIDQADIDRLIYCAYTAKKKIDNTEIIFLTENFKKISLKTYTLQDHKERFDFLQNQARILNMCIKNEETPKKLDDKYCNNCQFLKFCKSNNSKKKVFLI